MKFAENIMCECGKIHRVVIELKIKSESEC